MPRNPLGGEFIPLDRIPTPEELAQARLDPGFQRAFERYGPMGFSQEEAEQQVAVDLATGAKRGKLIEQGLSQGMTRRDAEAYAVSATGGKTSPIQTGPTGETATATPAPAAPTGTTTGPSGKTYTWSDPLTGQPTSAGVGNPTEVINGGETLPIAPNTHIALKGDTLSGLIAKYGGTKEDWLKANPQIAGDPKLWLYQGQNYNIPGTTAGAPTATPPSVTPGATPAGTTTAIPPNPIIQALGEKAKDTELESLKTQYAGLLKNRQAIESQMEGVPEELKKQVSEFVVNASQLSRLTDKQIKPLSDLLTKVKNTMEQMNIGIKSGELSAKETADREIQLLKIAQDLPAGTTQTLSDGTILKGMKTADPATYAYEYKDAPTNKTWRITVDKATGKELYRNDMGQTYKPESKTTDEKEIVSFQKDAGDLIIKLDTDEIKWGAAFDSLKAKYPQASNDAINNILGGGVAYDPKTKTFGTAWGRANKK